MDNNKNNSQFSILNSQLKKGYKKTEIGVIPEEWEIVKIGDITDVFAGGTPSTLIDSYWNGNIKWMNSGELNKKYIYDVDNRITKEGLKNSSTKIIPQKCVLVGLAGQGKTRGTAAINFVELCTNQSIAAIYPSKNHIPYYLYNYVDSKYSELRKLSTGDGGRGGLNLTIIKNIQIPLPPLPEQKAIATVLSDTDNLIQTLEKKIAKKQRIKKGAMQELLAPKEGWVKKTLGEAADINMGQSPNSEFYNNFKLGLPLIQGNADIKNRITIIRNYTSQITKKCKIGDIIMSVRAPVGEIAKATFDACIGRGVCAITYPNEYLYHYLIYIEPEWAKHSTGSTFDSVNSDTIKKLKISLPSLEEQTRIAQILSDMDAEIEALQKKLAKYKQLKQGLMQVLLTGKIRLV